MNILLVLVGLVFTKKNANNLIGPYGAGLAGTGYPYAAAPALEAAAVRARGYGVI